MGKCGGKFGACTSLALPPPPLHPDPLTEAERLAALFAARSSPSLLPPSVHQLQTLLVPARQRIIDAACAGESDTHAQFTIDELENVLSPRTDTAPGHDDITYSMLSNLGPYGKTTLLSLFNLSLREETLPGTWKTATIHPTPKPKDPGSLRPISLLSCLSKTMERMILARLKWKAFPFHPHLLAFQSQRSTSTCLMTLLGNFRSRKGLVVFLDLQKAFELASPLAILEALTRKGIGGRILC